MAGDWYLLRHLRHDRNIASSHVRFEAVNDDMYRLHYAIGSSAL